MRSFARGKERRVDGSDHKLNRWKIARERPPLTKRSTSWHSSSPPPPNRAKEKRARVREGRQGRSGLECEMASSIASTLARKSRKAWLVSLGATVNTAREKRRREGRVLGRGLVRSFYRFQHADKVAAAFL